MAGFHFFLPQVFSWETDLRHMPRELSWAVLSLNCFFSLLLLCAGVKAITSWRKWELRASSSLTLSVFWCVNVAYQLLVPPPWPRMTALVLLGFAIVTAAVSLAISVWDSIERALIYRFRSGVWVRIPSVLCTSQPAHCSRPHRGDDRDSGV
jgi:hypothetical protein